MTQPGAETGRSLPAEPPWWSRAVFYGVDLRFFADSNHDGVGDLNGLRQRLGYLELLGIDALWLYSPFAAPLTEAAAGRELDPVIGTVDSFEYLVDEAHDSGLRLAVDVAVDPAGTDRSAWSANLRFWLDRGIDGVRVSAAPGRSAAADETVRELLRQVRPVVDEYPGRALGVLVDDHWFQRYTDRPQWDLGIDLRLGDVGFDADQLQGAIDQILYSTEAVGVLPAWTVTARDRTRVVQRLGGGPMGVERARAMALVLLALPGVIGIDNGEELALPGPRAVNATTIRTPMVWEGDAPPFGFSDAPGIRWWPITEHWAEMTVEEQLEEPSSTLTLYRHALQIRREHPSFRGDHIEWFGAPPGCFAFRRAGSSLTCALNTSTDPVTLPPGEVLLASGPLPDDKLPANTAAWLA